MVVGDSVFGVCVGVGRHGLCVFLVAREVELDAVEILQGLVGRQRELAVLVDAVLALLGFLGRGLACGGPERRNGGL